MSLVGWPIARRFDRVAVGSRARSGAALGGMHFPNRPESVSLVRRFIKIVIETHGVTCISEVATLLASELAGNAVMHASDAPRDHFEILVHRRADRLRIEVHDGSHELPITQNSGLLDEAGRGLLLVAELADEHGAYRQLRGKVVWFELAAR